MATSYFVYNSGSFTDPLSYTRVSIPPSCPGGTTPCTVFAEVQKIEDVDRPVITPPLSTEITTATNTGIPSTNVELKS